MADAPKETIESVLGKLDALKQTYLANVGKPNHNPHLRIAQLITPLVNQLKAKDATLTPQILDAVSKLPSDSPVIDPNWQPSVEPKDKPVATAANSGPLNAR